MCPVDRVVAATRAIALFFPSACHGVSTSVTLGLRRHARIFGSSTTWSTLPSASTIPVAAQFCDAVRSRRKNRSHSHDRLATRGRDRYAANRPFRQKASPWVRRAYPKLIYFHQVEKGGHFAAWEQPELFASEMRAAFKSLR